jgi:hypothetical protein
MVSKAGPALFDNALLSGQAWVNVAKKVHRQCEAWTAVS